MKNITLILIFFCVLPTHFVFSQIVEPVNLMAGESTTAVIQHPIGIRKYVELKYQVHCATDIDSAAEMVNLNGGVAIGLNNSIIVEDKNLTKKNHSATVKQITCHAPLRSAPSQLGLASARPAVMAKPKYVLPEIDPTPVMSGSHLIPEFEFQKDNESLKISFALHCARSNSAGVNAVMFGGGISLRENSIMVIEDKFRKNAESVDNISVVKCDQFSREDSESDIGVE